MRGKNNLNRPRIAHGFHIDEVSEIWMFEDTRAAVKLAGTIIGFEIRMNNKTSRRQGIEALEAKTHELLRLSQDHTDNYLLNSQRYGYKKHFSASLKKQLEDSANETSSLKKEILAQKYLETKKDLKLLEDAVSHFDQLKTQSQKDLATAVDVLEYLKLVAKQINFPKAYNEPLPPFKGVEE